MKTSLQQVNSFLRKKRVAVLGVSRDPQDFSHRLFQEFGKGGYEAIPVNPNADEIDNQPCFSGLKELQSPVEAALIMTPINLTDNALADCVNAGVENIWIYNSKGFDTLNSDTLELCHQRNVNLITGLCPYMFWSDSSWFHRFHGWVMKMTGGYPKSK